MIPALRITVKLAFGDHPFVKLRVVAQKTWLLNEAYWDRYCHYCEFVNVNIIKTALTVR